jgi:phosphatidylglycerophosphate synthase
MRRGRVEPLVALLALLAVLTALAATVGLEIRGWVAALATGALGAVLLSEALTRARRDLGPADRVTVLRAVLVGGVTALAADGSDAARTLATLTGLATLALVLDAVDGWAARRSGTASRFGAGLDMEVDAFLILVLSVVVARTAGGWVLAIGAARYALLAVEPVLPWLRAPLPPRFWAKVVAAVTGVVLTAAASGLLPQPVTLPLLVTTLGLLAESFGRQVLALRRLHRESVAAGASGASAVAGDPARRSRLRTAGAVVGTSSAVAVTWAALVMPNQPGHLRPAAFLRIPVELLLLAAAALVLGRRAGRLLAAGFGSLLAVLLVLKVLDVGFFTVFSRPVDPLNDWVLLGPAVGVLRDSVGRNGALVVLVLAAIALLAVLSLLPLAAMRVTRLVAERRPTARLVVGALAAAWLVLALSGTQLVPRLPVASSSTSALAVDQVDQVRSDLRDRTTFAALIDQDRLRSAAPDQLLAGLRGKDVLLVFVESYGRVALEDSSFAPAVRSLLDDGTDQLTGAGYAARSAFLTSPTFGAGSWLAHASLQSGLWVDSQQRYGQLFRGGDRMTLTSAFGRAGWRTVLDSPADTRDWPQGRSFYRFDRLYTAHDVGYEGPSFSYATIPDQYTFAALRRLELSPPGRPPVMAEVDLVSSHHPWAPLPRFVPWGEVGDGSVYRGMPEQGPTPEQVFRHRDDVRAAYGASIEYALHSLVSFLTTYPDPDLVVVVLGDHQPHSYVTGPHPGFDVPISVIAQDPDVMARVSGWGWEDGLLPSTAAPVWRMDAFRNRFLTAFGTAPAPSVAPAAAVPSARPDARRL